MSYPAESISLKRPYLFCTLKLKDKVAAEIKDVEYFSATADMWTSNTAEPYLNYTIHFVGNDCGLDTRCLQVL